MDFTYDPLYRLINADYPGITNDRTYTYDGVGNRLTETKGGQTYTYVYNTVFSYTEGFESGLGDWMNVSGDDMDWTRRSGSTPSPSTGHSGAHGGSYYVYTEASSPNYPAKTAILEGPSFDLSDASQAELTFWYHMYGSAMGALNVEVSADGQIWTNVWSLSGNQGNAWYEANVDLTAHCGTTIAIRFRGVTGTSFTSDMAVDDIMVEASAEASTAGNRLAQVKQGSATIFKYYYDDNGNRIEKRDGSGILLQSCTYDQKNRIASITTAADTHYFEYDPNDYRISKMDSGGTRVYLLEGEHYEAVYDGAAQILAKYLRGVVVDEIVNGYYYDDQGKKTNYTFHHDHLRSVVGLTDHQGTTVETTKYGPFGEEIASTGSSDNFLKYTGREHDEDTGLYYYRARYYDPEIGRFLTEDPWGFDAGVNFYTSVSNNPVNYNDPMGLAPGDWWDLRNYDFDKAIQIANQLKNIEAPALARQLTDDPAQQSMLLWNGPLDAWRHAEWNRRMTEELNAQVAFIAGVGHELDTIAEWIGNKISGKQNTLTFDQMMKETWMDLSNNFVGRNAADNGVNRISYNNPLLTYGTGGVNGQPDTGFLGYNAVLGLSAISVADPSLVSSSMGGGAGGGFVLYPNKPNTNMMRNVYSK